MQYQTHEDLSCLLFFHPSGRIQLPSKTLVQEKQNDTLGKKHCQHCTCKNKTLYNVFTCLCTLKKLNISSKHL